MKLTYKIIAGIAATLTLSAAGIVYAHQGGGMGVGPGMGPGMGMGMGMGHMGPGMGMGWGMQGMGPGAMVNQDLSALAASRMAQLKSDLKITPNQEAAWKAFETAVLQQSAAMQSMRSEMHAQMQSNPSGVDHNAQRDKMIKLHETSTAARSAALKDLNAVLTPEQKAIADRSANVMGGHRAQGGRFGHFHGPLAR